MTINASDIETHGVFGYKFFIVRTDSMRATDFGAGDIIFVKCVEPETLRKGDIISFVSQNTYNLGITVTHKIRDIIVIENGAPAFVTYGTTTGVNDETPVTYNYVLGKYVGKIPRVGAFFEYLKTVPGYILIVFIPFFLLILYQGFQCFRLFKVYKKEQMQEYEEKLAQLEEERKYLENLKKEIENSKGEIISKEDQKDGNN